MSLFLLLLAAASFTLIASQTIVRTLPGYNGRLPFKLETGYIGVGEDEAVQLFYYFVESEGNPEVDPLIIWLAGGPGCSTLMAFFFEIGPLQIQYGNFIDDVPALQLDPNSWTKVANIIYLDAPARTGYSYTKTEEAARTSDTLSGSQTAEFIRKFLRDHPKFLNNPMYVTGISYSGIVIPMITEELYKGNDEGLEPIINIKGYVAGNPLTNKPGDINSRLEYAYRVALISEELFESTKRDCGGEYAEADSNNLLCMSRIDQVNQRVKDINIQQILEPNCDTSTNLVRSVNPIKRGNRRSLRANLMKMVHAQSSLEDTICPEYDDREYAILWANNKKVKKALNVREESVKEFSICNNYMQYNYGDTLLPLYDFNVLDSVVYHKKLSKRNSRALIFSGDHDMLVPHIGTYNWINSLNLTTTGNKWDAWYTNGQLAGYKTTYAHNNYSLAFATVKGGSHTAPVDKPVQCFEMIKRWFAHESI